MSRPRQVSVNAPSRPKAYISPRISILPCTAINIAIGMPVARAIEMCGVLRSLFRCRIKLGRNSMRESAMKTWYAPMMAVLLAKTSNALALIATSICKKILPQWPASKEISWFDSTGSLASGVRRSVDSMVSNGLVNPMVNTTSKSAIPATFLCGYFITGESWEILSSPENARKAPANPVRKVTGLNGLSANILGSSAKKSPKDICVNTVNRIARSLRNAITAPTRLTFALSLMPTQFKIPSKTRMPTVSQRANGPIAGITTLKYSIPDRQLIAAVKK
jgi:hypothetical protein